MKEMLKINVKSACNHLESPADNIYAKGALNQSVMIVLPIKSEVIEQIFIIDSIGCAKYAISNRKSFIAILKTINSDGDMILT